MSSENTRSCQVKVSTIFTFESPAYQTACNNIYINVSTMDNTRLTTNKNNTNFIKFGSDLERMQYLLGAYSQKPPPSQ